MAALAWMNGILDGDGVQCIFIQHMSILSKDETYKDPQTTYKEPYKWVLAQVCEAHQELQSALFSCLSCLEAEQWGWRSWSGEGSCLVEGQGEQPQMR